MTLRSYKAAAIFDAATHVSSKIDNIIDNLVDNYDCMRLTLD